MSKNIEPKFIKPPSLMNIGANYYLNSAFQGMSSCDLFLEDLAELRKKYNHLEKLSLFHKLIDILNGGKCDRMEISRDPIFRNWNKSGQQDSFELMAYVMNEVYNEIRKDLENTERIPKRDMQAWLKEDLPMRIIIEYKIRCPCNNKVKVPLQSDLALHVAIPSHESLDLQGLVDRFFHEEEIEDYKCENERCDGKNTKRYTRLLRPLPKTLCIHLQRTFWNGRITQKIDKLIRFTNQLKIKSKFSVSFNNEVNSHTDSQFNGTTQNKVKPQNDNIRIDNKKKFDGCNSNDETDNNQEMENDEENNSDKTKINTSYSSNNISRKLKICQTSFNENINSNQIDTSHQHNNFKDDSNEDDIYNLASVIVHYGSVYGGHYICYKKMNDKWFLTNDSSIRQVTEEDVLKCEAYILFYEKP